MNLQELQKEAHACAVEKGWHESDELGPDGKPTPRQNLAWLALITDELDEAEAEEEAFYIGPDGKPEGKLIEIVDAMIRLLDMAGACGTMIDIAPEDKPTDYDVYTARSVLVSVIRSGEANELRGHLSAFYLAICHEFILSRNDATEDESPPDWGELMKLKMAYNRTRQHRHGGKLA